MRTYNYYPPEVYSINEDITRRNMKAYDKRREAYYTGLREFCPEYNTLRGRDRLKILREYEERTGARL